ncbi:D-alanyl-D-alanine carboxypeptidase family protein [Periweissella ghanensis]|uniref:D-alanyl-D-alanine carboxypeptidase DacA n=1 Tax=Periweissella ghanensis TaxID=467997 RepID=A0ABN8BMN0_9LACO|nr:serine hydrolase [Periweissella ghanensis]MCM0600929.1 D-alanyl-D-alanine carboxypeptidase [Periweissella ghanensis]CAH0417653.1 D-alanyl-D-alanine carboxypeptidase DacA [Periweissella ghanensis]
MHLKYWISSGIVVIGAAIIAVNIDEQSVTTVASPVEKTAQRVPAAEATYVKPEYQPVANIANLTATSASIYDLDAHSFIFTKNAHNQEFNASTSKLMAMYVIYKRLQVDPNLHWSDQVKITNPGIVKLSTVPGLGEIPMTLNKTYTAQALAENAMVVSSNESITALGIWAFGSNDAMIKAMNTEAQEMQLTQTHFYTTSGLDVDDVTPYGLQLTGAPKDGRNTSSAYDLTMLSQALITEFPQILQLTALPQVTIDNVVHQSTDRYLKGFEFFDPKHGIDGLKTGTTPAAGQVFVGTSMLPGKHRIITVVMHSNDRFNDTNKLLAAIQR